ncbi:MAG: endonuclease/exonuclease/phosphatase family protein [Bacteroidota bacterium]
MKRILYKILLAVNIIFALALLLSYLAYLINPEDIAFPAFFGLAYPYILLTNIALAVVWAMLLRFEALISVIVIALGFNHLTNYIKLSKPANKGENSFQVMSYNLRLFNYFETNSNNSEKNVIEFIKTQQPDILCLQEFFITGTPSQKETSLKAALGGKYHSHIKVIGSGRNRYYGIVTFSKFPIIRKSEIIHPRSSSLSIFTDVVIENDTFRIFNNHLQSFRLQNIERSFIEEITTPDDAETLNEVRKISGSLKQGFVRRAHQSQLVKVQINSSPYPVIVVGDFNDTPVSYSYRKIRKGLNDSFVSSGYGAGFTYKGNYPPNRIDYILYDNALESTYFETLKVKYSDHYPIVAYFRKSN